MGELVFTASHQATLIRYLTEAISLYSLKILILDEFKFCQGRVYHEQQPFVEDVKAHKKVPYVWHMCWTDTRDQKVPCIYTLLYSKLTYIYISVYSYSYTCSCASYVGWILSQSGLMVPARAGGGRQPGVSQRAAHGQLRLYCSQTTSQARGGHTR